MNKPSAEKWWGISSLVSALFVLAVILSGCASRVAEPIKQAKAEREAWSLILDQLGYERMDIWLNQAKRLPLGAYAEADKDTQGAVWCLVTKDCESGTGTLTVEQYIKLQESMR